MTNLRKVDLVGNLMRGAELVTLTKQELNVLLATTMETSLVEICKGLKAELDFPENENMDTVIATIKAWKAKATQ